MLSTSHILIQFSFSDQFHLIILTLWLSSENPNPDFSPQLQSKIFTCLLDNSMSFEMQCLYPFLPPLLLYTSCPSLPTLLQTSLTGLLIVNDIAAFHLRFSNQLIFFTQVRSWQSSTSATLHYRQNKDQIPSPNSWSPLHEIASYHLHLILWYLLHFNNAMFLSLMFCLYSLRQYVSFKARQV